MLSIECGDEMVVNYGHTFNYYDNDTFKNDTYKYDNKALNKLEFVSDAHKFSKEITPMNIEIDKLSFEMNSPHKKK